MPSIDASKSYTRLMALTCSAVSRPWEQTSQASLSGNLGDSGSAGGRPLIGRQTGEEDVFSAAVGDIDLADTHQQQAPGALHRDLCLQDD